jgi:hypothetical protein
VITGATREEAELKALWQQRAWEEQWQRVRQARERQQQCEEAAHSKESRKQDAEEHTKQAVEAMAALENLLHAANSAQGCEPQGGQNVYVGRTPKVPQFEENDLSRNSRVNEGPNSEAMSPPQIPAHPVPYEPGLRHRWDVSALW